jgi:hypothetical protein
MFQNKYDMFLIELIYQVDLKALAIFALYHRKNFDYEQIFEPKQLYF